MTATVEIPIRVMDMPELEAFKRAFVQMATALKAIEQGADLHQTLAEAHIVEPTVKCWCDPKVEHVPAGG